MTKNQKIAAAIGVAVLVLIALGIREHNRTASVPSTMSSSSPFASATSTQGASSTDGAATSVAAPSAKPVTVQVPLGKTKVDHASTIGLTFNGVDAQTRDDGSTSMVASFSINTNVCTPGQGCAARADQKKSIQSSAPYQFDYKGYTVKLDSVTATIATFTISKSSAL